MAKPHVACDGFSISVDRKPHLWQEPFITGAELKRLAGVDPATYCVWMQIQGSKDREIGDDERVDLRSPGRERFFTGRNCTTEGATSASVG